MSGKSKPQKQIESKEFDVISIESKDFFKTRKLRKKRVAQTKGRIRLTKKVPILKTISPKFTAEAMIGATNDLRPINFLIIGAKIQEAVAKVVAKIITMSGEQKEWYGTGFMISDDLFMTNHHVLPNIPMKIPNTHEEFKSIIDCTILFDYQSDWKGIAENPSSFKCELDFPNYYVGDPTLDYAIVKIKDGAGKKFGKVLLDYTTKVFERTPVIIIQHPGGGQKQIALENNLVERINRGQNDAFPTSLIRYSTDTEEGSSGSPVFTPAWDLVALHHGNEEFLNEGTLSKAIIDDILKKLPTLSKEMQEFIKAALVNSNLPPESKEISDINKLVQRRFFESEGLTIEHEVSGVKKLVHKNESPIEFLDVAFWDLTQIVRERNLSSQKIVTLSDYIHDIGIDLWGITKISQSELEGIRMTLNENYNQTFSYILGESVSSRFTAILYDASKLECRPKEIQIDLPAGKCKLQLINVKSKLVTQGLDFNLIALDLKIDTEQKDLNEKINGLIGWISKSIKTNPNDKYLLLFNPSNDPEGELTKKLSTVSKLAVIQSLKNHDRDSFAYIEGNGKTTTEKIIIPAETDYKLSKGDVKIIRSDKKIPRYIFESPKLTSQIFPLAVRLKFKT
jgi:V8-like Glu-specific endopeptidase